MTTMVLALWLEEGSRGVRKAVATWMAAVVPVPRWVGNARVCSICAASHFLSEHTERQACI